ncbi:MAG: phosphotransferase, partial [Leptolyngbyaceae cyanobacterium CSU_1_4]|nr:phosphotransferase [Leptolyngbyaceae cyanobacterium CSU_1_4]
MDNLVSIAAQFANYKKIAQVQPFGKGNINDTFLVTIDEPGSEKFILQRINTQVFRHPHLVMQNMCRLTQHVHNRLQKSPLDRRWETPQVLLNQRLEDYWEENRSFWRAISFIQGSQSFDTIRDQEDAQ